MKLQHTILTAAIAAFSTLTADAALFTWGAATNITSDSDISTAGALVGAVNLGSAGVGSPTVNGVAFTDLAVGGISVSLGNFTLATTVGLGGTNSIVAPAGFSAGYQSLLSSQAFTFGGGDAVLTMSGLVTGQSYLFQWWSSDGSALNTSATSESQTVTLNASAAVNRGQFATATFTADASGTQVITFGGGHHVNAFQLRNVSPAVPEPGTALAGVMLAGLLGVRRRRA